MISRYGRWDRELEEAMIAVGQFFMKIDRALGILIFGKPKCSMCNGKRGFWGDRLDFDHVPTIAEIKTAYIEEIKFAEGKELVFLKCPACLGTGEEK